MGDFNHPGIRWKDTTSRYMQPSKFLKCLGDKFLTWVIKVPTRKDFRLDLILNKQERPIEELNVGSSLGCKDYEMGGVQGNERKEKTNSRISGLPESRLC